MNSSFPFDKAHKRATLLFYVDAAAAPRAVRLLSMDIFLCMRADAVGKYQKDEMHAHTHTGRAEHTRRRIGASKEASRERLIRTTLCNDPLKLKIYTCAVRRVRSKELVLIRRRQQLMPPD